MSPFAKILESLIAQGDAPSTVVHDTFADVEVALARSLALGETDDAFPWARELGVAWPCTATELRRAFRRRAFETHPDRAGGSHAAFLRTQSLLEQAMNALEAPPTKKTAALRYGRAPTEHATRISAIV